MSQPTAGRPSLAHPDERQPSAGQPRDGRPPADRRAHRPGVASGTLAGSVGRYARTVRGLRPEQVAARVRLRGQRALADRLPGLSAALIRRGPPVGGWPPGFLPFDGRCQALWPDATQLVAGRLSLLGHVRTLHPPDPDAGLATADWAQARAPLLWRYHLHYWDWAWTLTGLTDRDAARDRFGALYASWRAATMPGQGVPWSPYVVSLRAWSLCGLRGPLAAGTPTDRWLAADLGHHRAFLRAHLETDVGGNHLVKNLKALIGLGIAAGDRADTERWTCALLRQLDRQVLADGGHIERAPAYHCQVLADLRDVADLLTAAGRPLPGELVDAIARMRGWLSAVLGPLGTVPLLNDGFPLPSAATRMLLASPPPRVAARTDVHEDRRADENGSAGRNGSEQKKNGNEDAVADPEPVSRAGTGRDGAVRLLAPSGLAVLRAGRWHLLADVGAPCPDDLPAHAHADTLSFLLWHDDTPLIVDTATSTYAPGPDRALERSTRAHNTVVVDGQDSTEVWGAFRAGRRARVTIGEAGYLPAAGSATAHARLTASHDGYRWLPGAPSHQRTWRLDADGPRIDDLVTGHGRHRVEVLFHLAPGMTARADAEGLLFGHPGDPGRIYVLRAAGGGWRTEASRVATGWGRTEPAVVAVYELTADLPVRLRTSMERWQTPASRMPPGQATSPDQRVPEPGDAACTAERLHA
ncbi:alginate lyase family protein [Pseudofrankia sp. BMG5.37]|uniref:alginate lyase family protein n=1 Tax=Pseudofrankia sp. BMG5.37 TaxID=3050035 RepID=UPI002895674E|nr:alginate lyase family protein [Pseudofrankia sp. BMG5.37]MDT3443972.1 alginate lyase family protein [Pseudofrankia sp. BMG5.37]